MGAGSDAGPHFLCADGGAHRFESGSDPVGPLEVRFASDSIDSSKVAPGSLTGADLATNSITTTQIAESGLNLAFNCGGGMVKAQVLIRNGASSAGSPARIA